MEAVSTGPIILQLRGCGPNDPNSAVAQSGPFICVVPRRQILRISSPWYSRDVPANRILIAADALCEKGDTSHWATYTLTYTVQLSPEMVPAACPKQELEAVQTEDFYKALVGREEANPN